MSLSTASRVNEIMNGPTDSGEPPRIVSQLLASAESVDEGDPLQLVLEISRDGDVTVDWFKDGQLINAGSRLNTSIDRGFASLDIFYTHPEDSGNYSCVVSNRFGQAKSNQISIRVICEAISNVEEALREQIAAMNALQVVPDDRELRSVVKEVPKFISQLTCPDAEVLEGSGSRFEATINISSDSTLSVDWFKDGSPIGTGSRFNVKADRGYLILEIAYCFREDSGEYICIAKNALGEAKSNPVQFKCLPEDRVVTKSILGESSMQHLKALEDPGEAFGRLSDNYLDASVPPSFRGPLTPNNLEVVEDQPVEFSVPVDTGMGNIITLEWRKDGNIIKYGSRITGSLELGIASLKIKYSQPEDTGQFSCVLKTEHGIIESNPVYLVCSSEDAIIAASQLPGDRVKGLQAIQDLEAILNAPRDVEYEDDDPMPPPSITKQPEPVRDLEDGAPVHFEALIEPAMDPNLNVEWFKDDKPLTNGTRFRVEYDRGLAVLDLLYSIEEDSGSYWCLVKNGSGQLSSNKISIKCSGCAQVITHSNLLQGLDGYKLIQAIEDNSADIPEYNYETEEADTPPVFDVKPQPVITCEGGNAKFLVRLSGKPTPNVNWTINGEEIRTDSITKVYNDGAINYLEIGRCPFERGVYEIKILASNTLGKAEVSTVMTVQPSEDFRPDLKHIKPENVFKKILGLKKVTVSEELGKALSKSKPSPQVLIDMERGSEIKAKTFKSPEVIEAENLLDKIAINLRKSEMKKPYVNGNAN